MEAERRAYDPQTVALRVRRYDFFDARRLGDQQRDDPARGRDVFRLAGSGFGIAAGRLVAASVAR